MHPFQYLAESGPANGGGASQTPEQGRFPSQGTESPLQRLTCCGESTLGRSHDKKQFLDEFGRVKRLSEER